MHVVIFRYCGRECDKPGVPAPGNSLSRCIFGAPAGGKALDEAAEFRHFDQGSASGLAGLEHAGSDGGIQRCAAQVGATRRLSHRQYEGNKFGHINLVQCRERPARSPETAPAHEVMAIQPFRF